MEVTSYELFAVPPRWQFLRVETDAGLVGWGEPVVEGRADATAAAVRTLMDEYLLGRDPLDIEHHWQAMYRGGFYRGGPVLLSALSGIDQALWDIKGKHYDAPVYDLLGGKVRDRIKLYAHCGGDTPEEAAESARDRVDAGFRAVKYGPKPRWEWLDTPAAVDGVRETVAAIREAVGDDVDLALDFHGRPSKAVAKRLAAALEPYDPAFYEEIVGPERTDRLVEVARHTTVPIAVGERQYSRWDFEPILATEAVDVLQPDVSHAGGITELRKIAALAETYDVGIAPHAPLGPVNLAASLHVDACTQNATIQEQIVHQAETPNYLVDDAPFDLDADGFAALPPGPGLGVEVDEDAVRAAATDDAWEAPLVRREDGSVAEW
jgi:galactonate dehydratase